MNLRSNLLRKYHRLNLIWLIRYPYIFDFLPFNGFEFRGTNLWNGVFLCMVEFNFKLQSIYAYEIGVVLGIKVFFQNALQRTFFGYYRGRIPSF